MSEDNFSKGEDKDFSGMTLIFDKEGNNPSDLWTTERFKEEFFLCLTTVTEIEIVQTGIRSASIS